jgi:quinol monooxygenase YgiN
VLAFCFEMSESAGDNGIIKTQVILKVKPELRQQVYDYLINDINITLQHKGCVTADVILSADDDVTITLSSDWSSEQDHQDYVAKRSTSGFQEYLMDKLCGPPVFKHSSKDTF